MHPIITEREIINLPPAQEKMIRSGWGNSCADNAIVEKITYKSDGLNVKGYIAYPKDQSRKYPCIIWCRGGIGEAGKIDEFNARGIFGQIAGWGYVVFASQYRGNAGGEGIDRFGGDDLNDVLNLIPLANQIQCADNSLWGIEGWSRGGMMTYLTLTRTNLFKAAVVSGGIANLKCNSSESPFMKQLYLAGFGGGSGNNFLKECEYRSIINFPEKLSRTTPLLIIHGAKDERVPPHDSIDLSYKLLELDIPFRLLLLEGGDHYLKSHRKETDELRRNWFKKYLK
jgi:dipeptidyl aminopeptidase/acylaminoacyl peptidase